MNLKSVHWRDFQVHKPDYKVAEPSPEQLELGKKRRTLEQKLEDKALRKEFEMDNLCW